MQRRDAPDGRKTRPRKEAADIIMRQDYMKALEQP